MRTIISEYNQGEWLFTDCYSGQTCKVKDEELKSFCIKYSQYHFIILNNENSSIFLRKLLTDLGVSYYEYINQTNSTNDNAKYSEILLALKNIEKNMGNNSSKSSFFSFSKLNSENNVIGDSKHSSVITQMTHQLQSLTEKISGIEYIVNELYNQEPNQSDKSSIVIEDLRRELSSYKEDLYLKSMQKYGVDIAIKIIDRLYAERRDLNESGSFNNEIIERYNKLIEFCSSEFRRLNLRIFNSNSGDLFDGERMVSYDDYVETEDHTLNGRVAYSISPSISWTLPRVNSDSKTELVLKEEIVALYKTI